MKKFIFIQLNKLSLILLFFLTLSFSFSQQIFTGLVVDSLSQKPIEYATIGLTNFSDGTITDSNGKFIIKALSTDTLLIRFLGYRSLKLPISKIQNTSNTIIYLKESVIELDEVVVKKYEYVDKIQLGAESKHPRFLYNFENYKDGNEIARRINIDKPVKINKVTFFVKDLSFENIRIRINFYELDGSKKPASKIPSNIIHDITKKGKVVINIEEHDIELEEDFLVSVEAIDFLGSGEFTLMAEFYGNYISKSGCFFRNHNLDSWEEKLPHNLAITLDATESINN